MHAARNMFAGLLQGPVAAVLLAAVLLGGSAAEAPLPYHYPAPGAPGAVVKGFTADRPAAATPGYVSPSLLVASAPPAVLNYQPQLNGDYQPDADVHKHVYVHVAPEEPADQQSGIIVPTPKPKKHYKIVFIKTPTLRPAASAYVNLPQPDQEKTLIYVLTKKPSLQQQLVVSTPAPTPPAKPEVFFIRYKTNEDQRQPQLTYANGALGQNHVTYTNNAHHAQNVKPLTNSYGVPLGAPLNTLQYSGLPSATPTATNNINYNTI